LEVLLDPEVLGQHLGLRAGCLERLAVEQLVTQRGVARTR
jgi:hypothetical protein